MNFSIKHTLPLLVLACSCGAYAMDEQVNHNPRTFLGKTLKLGVKTGAYTTVGASALVAGGAISAGIITSSGIMFTTAGQVAGTTIVSGITTKTLLASCLLLPESVITTVNNKINYCADKAGEFGDFVTEYRA